MSEVGLAHWVNYCCPRCKRPVESSRDTYICEVCHERYPVVLGIPDFRVFPDPYITRAEDYEKAEQLSRKAAALDFNGLVKFYWSITPDTPTGMAERFSRQAFAAEARGRHLLASAFETKDGSDTQEVRDVLDLGCRTGGLTVAAAEKFERVVGIDIAFRWLIIARKRLDEAGRQAQLVCCCAQFLPFAENTFDLAAAENVLEHTALQQELIVESHRALRPRGIFIATTWNRLSVAPEPHVRLWGIGWMPRGIAKRYVTFRRKIPYDDVRLLSIFELRQMLRSAPFAFCDIGFPEISSAQLANASGLQRHLAAIYEKIRDWRFLRSILLLIAPVFLVKCVREKGESS